MNSPARRIYFDYAATSPLDPRVRAGMGPYFEQAFGNPDSRTHPFGWEAEEAVALAREQVAALLLARPEEIVFTSGATESINLALKGVLRAKGRARGHLIISAIEHSAGLEPARSLRDEGFTVTEVAPDPQGRIDVAAVRAALRPDTALVSVIHANNEIGVLQDLGALGALCAQHGVHFHTDATQSFGKVPLQVSELPVQLLSCSGHKICGPKGVGALFVRRQRPRIELRPLIDGGGQERGLRSGTLNVPAVVGFGIACRLAAEEMKEEGERVAALRDRLEAGALGRVPGCHVHGKSAPRAPGITNLGLEGVSAEALLLGMRSVAFSAGSACASASLEPSHVLLALGLSPEEARNSVRLSLGRFTTAEEVDAVIEELAETVGRIRRDRPPA